MINWLPASEGTLPAVGLRERVADALHCAVGDVTGTDGMGLCALYALAGSLVLNLLQQRSVYFPQAGSLWIVATQDEQCAAFDAEEGGFTAGEYHAWIVRAHRIPGRPGPHRSVRTGTDPLRQASRFEVIDFTSRFYRAHCERNGLPWEQPDPPACLWCWHGELRDYGLTLKANARTLEQLLTAQREREAALEIAERALALAASGIQTDPLSRQQRRAQERRAKKRQCWQP